MKDHPRLGKSVPFKSKYIVQFYHPVCLIELFHNARLATNVVRDVTEIENFDAMAEADQLHIKELLHQCMT